MSELLVAGLKIGFLVLLWLFLLIVANVIRTDLFGKAVAASDLAAEPRPSKKQAKKKGKELTLPRALAIVEGRQQGLEVPLGQPIDIGRAPGSTIVLDDDYCSTRHCTLRPDGEGGFYVEDFGSTNGTFINGHRISAPTAFGLADTLRIGHTTMKLVG